ncbi:MAG: alanyl-tRNA editing protein [Actinomycetota bacterium]
MATETLYLNDHYLREFEATIAETDGDRVALDRTAFYPTGGGQPHDTGTLDGHPVTEVRKEGDAIWHTVERGSFSVGNSVHGEVDWERRYALMRTHTALHILCGVIYRDYKAAVTGGNMNPLEARMDFEFEHMRAELVHEIERKVNEEIAAERPVSVEFLDRAAADVDPDLIRTKINLLPKQITRVRVVDIEGLDKQADGGTHVANTKEVGPVKIVDYKSKGRLNKRVRIALDALP